MTAERLALGLDSPSGESLKLEWPLDALGDLDPSKLDAAPAWQLAGQLDWDEVDVLRVVSGRLEDGRMIALAALRPSGAEGHDQEVVAGALATGDGVAALEGVLLSTEYGAEGEPRRLGIELYPAEDAMPLRLAADARAAAESVGGGVRTVRAALALRLAGVGGAGTYDELRRA